MELVKSSIDITEADFCAFKKKTVKDELRYFEFREFLEPHIVDTDMGVNAYISESIMDRVGEDGRGS